MESQSGMETVADVGFKGKIHQPPKVLSWNSDFVFFSIKKLVDNL